MLAAMSYGKYLKIKPTLTFEQRMAAADYYEGFSKHAPYFILEHVTLKQWVSLRRQPKFKPCERKPKSSNPTTIYDLCMDPNKWIMCIG